MLTYIFFLSVRRAVDFNHNYEAKFKTKHLRGRGASLSFACLILAYVSVRCLLPGYILEPRLNSRALDTADSVTIGLSVNRCSHKENQCVDEKKQDWLNSSRRLFSHGAGEILELNFQKYTVPLHSSVTGRVRSIKKVFSLRPRSHVSRYYWYYWSKPCFLEPKSVQVIKYSPCLGASWKRWYWRRKTEVSNTRISYFKQRMLL